MLEALAWQTFVILYEDSDGLVRLQDVLKLSSVYSELQITVRQLLPGPGDDYRYCVKICISNVYPYGFLILS